MAEKTVNIDGEATFGAKGWKGLRSLRKHNGTTPEYHCSNCRCNRYSPCGCMKKGSKRHKEEVVEATE